MTQGIILAAFGQPNYIYMAAHLAASLVSDNKDIKITLLHDHCIGYMPKDFYQFFDGFKEIKREHLYHNGKLDPGFLKINIPAYLPYDKTLYLDVDGLSLKDISPVFDTDKEFATEVIGKGQYGKEINYLFWTTQKNAWEYFNLNEESVYRSVQSSSMFFKKGKFVEKLHKMLVEHWDFPYEKLSNHWGGTIPDELIISGVCAKMNYDPSFNEKIVFFGFKNTGESFQEIIDRNYILSLYGGKGLVRQKYLDFYNRSVVRKLGKVGVNRISNAQILLRKKHAVTV